MTSSHQLLPNTRYQHRAFRKTWARVIQHETVGALAASEPADWLHQKASRFDKPRADLIPMETAEARHKVKAIEHHVAASNATGVLHRCVMATMHSTSHRRS